MNGTIFLFGEPEENIGLSNSGISNDNDLYHVIIIIHFVRVY